jgi:hypothetical protein
MVLAMIADTEKDTPRAMKMLNLAVATGGGPIQRAMAAYPAV